MAVSSVRMVWYLRGEGRILTIRPSLAVKNILMRRRHRMRNVCGMLLLALLAVSARAADLTGFTKSLDFDEQIKSQTLEGGVRLHVNAPQTVEANKPTLLIVYATPNGNTI